MEDSEIQEEIEPYMMARIVDFEEFIMQYPFDIISIHDDLHFIIDDPIMECNCGDFSLRWDAAGNTILERGGTQIVTAVAAGGRAVYHADEAVFVERSQSLDGVLFALVKLFQRKTVEKAP